MAFNNNWPGYGNGYGPWGGQNLGYINDGPGTGYGSQGYGTGYGGLGTGYGGYRNQGFGYGPSGYGGYGTGVSGYGVGTGLGTGIGGNWAGTGLGTGFGGYGTGVGTGYGGFGAGFSPGLGFGGPGFGGYGMGAGPGPGFSQQFYTTGLPDDEDIIRMVDQAIDYDPLIPGGADINVQSNAGVVTLTGTVKNKMIKHAVGQDAWWINGVTDVHNNIQVTGRNKQTQQSKQGQQGQTQKQAVTAGNR